MTFLNADLKYLFYRRQFETFSYFHPGNLGEMIQLGEHIIQMGWNHQLKVWMFDSSLVYEEKFDEQRDKSWLCENQGYRQPRITSSMEDVWCVIFFDKWKIYIL